MEEEAQTQVLEEVHLVRKRPLARALCQHSAPSHAVAPSTAAPQRPPRCGRPALWHYAWRGDDTGLKHLLDLGADASVVDGDGDGPLAAVARRGEARCIECVEILLKRGAPTDTRNDDGRTALWHASNYGRTKVVDALLRGGADANAGDRNRATPVHAACAAGRVACARLLIRNGGDARRLDGDGRSCLHAACKSGDVACVAAMLDALVDIDGRDALGQTALWQACRDGFADVCALLLTRGASPDVAAHSGRLPREIAEPHGHAAVIATFDAPAAPPARAAAAAAPPPPTSCQTPTDQLRRALIVYDRETTLLPLLHVFARRGG